MGLQRHGRSILELRNATARDQLEHAVYGQYRSAADRQGTSGTSMCQRSGGTCGIEVLPRRNGSVKFVFLEWEVVHIFCSHFVRSGLSCQGGGRVKEKNHRCALSI